MMFLSFLYRMEIDGRIQKYDNFLRLICNRLLVLGCKTRSVLLKCVKNGVKKCKNVLFFECC